MDKALKIFSFCPMSYFESYLEESSEISPQLLIF